MEYADKRGCYTWNPNPQSEETVTWSGGCVDGRASGKGKRVWRYRQQGEWKSSSQEGEMRAGIEHGHWILQDSQRNTPGKALMRKASCRGSGSVMVKENRLGSAGRTAKRWT